MGLIECVPNFSEGRDLSKIEAIVSSIESVDGVRLLHVDRGIDANRTVITFAGEEKQISEAAFRAIEKAAQLIDMSKQAGAHPRNGATDVCPFIPLTGSSFADCVELSRTLGARVGSELEIPVYLYALSASSNQRVDLAHIRKGEYEDLDRRMADDGFLPDFGPTSINRQAGATAIGARDFLIAFNVNLSTRAPDIAKRIATAIRKVIRAANGLESDATIAERSCYPPLKAIGWTMPSFGFAQISMNLLAYRKVGMYEAFELVKTYAEKEGIIATGSELVGLVPKEALLRVGQQVEGASEGDEKHLLRSAVRYLGLEAKEPFELEERVLEYRLEKLGLNP